MLWVRANDTHHPMAVNHLALVTQFLNRCPNLHGITLSSTIPKSARASDRGPKPPQAHGHQCVTAQNSHVATPASERSTHARLPALLAPARSAEAPSPFPARIAPLPARIPQALRSRQHPRAVIGHRHHVFEVSRIRPILRHRRPSIRKNLRFGPAGIHHRLDGQHHAGC